MHRWSTQMMLNWTDGNQFWGIQCPGKQIAINEPCERWLCARLWKGFWSFEQKVDITQNLDQIRSQQQCAYDNISWLLCSINRWKRCNHNHSAWVPCSMIVPFPICSFLAPFKHLNKYNHSHDKTDYWITHYLLTKIRIANFIGLRGPPIQPRKGMRQNVALPCSQPLLRSRNFKKGSILKPSDSLGPQGFYNLGLLLDTSLENTGFADFWWILGTWGLCILLC